MHRMMHRSHVGDNRVIFADRVAALVCRSPHMCSIGILTNVMSQVLMKILPNYLFYKTHPLHD